MCWKWQWCFETFLKSCFPLTYLKLFSRCYKDLVPGTASIMYVVHELKKNKCTDSTLLSNLDFAEVFLREHPLNKFSKLLVKGNGSGQCVEIGNSQSKVFTVSSDTHHNTYINLYIYSYNKVNKESIIQSHFFGHSCQDESKSCFMQAREAVPDSGLDRLTIKCNRFSIIYTNDSLNVHKTVETKCQLILQSENIAEGLLEKKIWLQKEKPNCHGLIACLDHLIKLHLDTPPIHNCRFIIHADNEIISIVSYLRQIFVSTLFPTRLTEYVLLCDNTGVSMFPSWE